MWRGMGSISICHDISRCCIVTIFMFLFHFSCCRLISNRIDGVMVIVFGSSAFVVSNPNPKLKTIKLVCVASPLGTQH